MNILINLLDVPIEQKEIAFSLVQGELFEEYDLRMLTNKTNDCL